MKYILPIALLLTIFSLTACVDTEEKIDINADNSGNYSLTLDMGKMIGMMNDMGAGKADPAKPKEKKDTTVYFKDVIVTNDKLTADEKELFKDAFCKIKLDEENAEMKIVVSCPFSNISRLATIKETLVAVMGKLDVMDKMGGKEKSGLSDPEEMNAAGDNVTKSMNPGSQYYKFSAAPGKISYLVTDKAALKNSLASDSSLILMQQMSAMTGEMSYKTIITVPSPIKKLNGGKGVLSDDKKSITYKSTLSDLMERPEEVEYEIEY
jgi:hypothetical protein